MTRVEKKERRSQRFGEYDKNKDSCNGWEVGNL